MTEKVSIEECINPLRYISVLQSAYLAIPTVGWTTNAWDDLSFSGVERGSVVVISTLGSKRDIGYFMRGYNEMIRRLAPPLIVAFGDILPEMTGRFINFRYEEAIAIDLKHKHHGVQPHKHIYLNHFDDGIAISVEEQRLVDRVRKEFNLK